MLRCNVAVAQDRIEDGHQGTIVRRISEHQWYEPSTKGESDSRSAGQGSRYLRESLPVAL